MERHELEDQLEKLILDSGVPIEEVVETLEMMLERYNDELDSNDESSESGENSE